MNNCEEYTTLMDGFLDGQLSQEEDAKLRLHLADCPDCQAYLQDMLDISHHFPTLEEVEVPPDFTAQVMSAVRTAQGAAPTPRPAPWRKNWRGLASVAACLVLMTILGLQGFLPLGGNSAPQAPQNMISPSVEESPEVAPASGDLQTQKMLEEEPQTLPPAEQDATSSENDEANVSPASVPPPAVNPPPAEQSPATERSGVNGPSIFAVNSTYLAELCLSVEEAGELLVNYLPLDSVKEGDVTTTRYALTVLEFQTLLAQFPDKAVTLPVDVSGYALVIVTGTN